MSLAKSLKKKSRLEERGKASLQKSVEGESIEEFIKTMTCGGKAKIHAQHDALRKQERHIFFFVRFPEKNRFSNMVMFNEGAVLLTKEKETDIPYYHASNVQSRFGKFICAQAPLEDTLIEWYMMIWQQKIQIIVCLENPQAKKSDCWPYFEFKKDKKMKIKSRFQVRTISHRQECGITNFELKLKNLCDSKAPERTINVLVYTKWQLGQMTDTRGIINLMHNMWALEQSLNSLGENNDAAPILVHGCSGIRRTGAFVTIASVCKSIHEQGMVCLLPFVTYIRRFRYGVMRNRHAFAITLDTILQYSVDQGQIPKEKKNVVLAAMKVIHEAMVPETAAPEDLAASTAAVSTAMSSGENRQGRSNESRKTRRS